jgi:hypothetical protein
MFDEGPGIGEYAVLELAGFDLKECEEEKHT